jgi:hypothetical protein
MSLFGLKTKGASSQSHNAALGITGREMPPIKIMAPSSVRYYKLHFLDDGFPAQKRSDGTYYEHPLYPIYIAEEYFRQNARTPDPALVDAARLVIDAALKRAEPFKDALVFWYGADAKVTRAAHRHYSALTQAYYVGVLAKLQELVGRRAGYNRLARQFANSLAIPATEGGVMQVRPQGKGIEELPLDMPELVLNGWLSALTRLAANPKVLERAGMTKFVNENLDLLEYLLPRYDMPSLLNSRYSLSGYAYLRLTAASGATITLRDARTSWSATERYTLGTGSAYRWANFLLEDDIKTNADGSHASKGRSLRANLVLSQLADQNAFEFVARASKPSEVRFEMMVGEYSPFTTVPAATKWVRLETVTMTTEPRAYAVKIGTPHTDLIGYPTNFQKSFDGKNRNVYHPIHIKGLHQLHRYQDRPSFLDYAKRWTGYIARWKDDPLYARFAGHDYGSKIPGPLRRHLTGGGSGR